MTRVFTAEETAKWIAGWERRMSSGAVVLRDEKDHILIVKTTYHEHWSLPGGIIDEGETPRQAAIREVKEEIGIDLDESMVSFRHVMDHVSSFAHTYQFVFEAPMPKTEIVLDQDEIEMYEIVSREQILSNDRNYSDSITLWANDFYGYDEREFVTIDQISE